MINLPKIINQLASRFENHVAKSKRRAVVKSALIAVTNRHSDWADVAFDEHFVANQGAEIMADYVQYGQLPDAAALAEAWSNQFNWQSATKSGAQARFMHVAEDFVYILSTAPVQAAAVSTDAISVQPQPVEALRYGYQAG